jgi:two-component system chemotaxis response regulator CheB
VKTPSYPFRKELFSILPDARAEDAAKKFDETRTNESLGCNFFFMTDFQHVVVVGASAGGVKALCALVKALPAPSPVPIYIVLHSGPDSLLDEILTACDSHRVRFVENGERIRKGIFVSRPRRHLVVNSRTLGLSDFNAAKREFWIPSIDELFESTAKSQGTKSIGVILSGTMHDGVAGLLSIRNAGGTTLAQEPDEAQFPQMPNAVLEARAVDYCLPIKEMAVKLSELCANQVEASRSGIC